MHAHTHTHARTHTQQPTPSYQRDGTITEHIWYTVHTMQPVWSQSTATLSRRSGAAKSRPTAPGASVTTPTTARSERSLTFASLADAQLAVVLVPFGSEAGRALEHALAHVRLEAFRAVRHLDALGFTDAAPALVLR